MAEKHILRDSDKVYDNPDVTCSFITSFILSKGDLKTNKVRNEFCNVEVLEWSTCFYMALTSGHLGGDDINVLVRRYNSKVYAKEAYDDECAKRLKDGFSPVEVISIYPNCSESAKQFVSEKNMVSKSDAEKILEENKDKNIELSIKTVEKEKLNPKVEQFVRAVYHEASQSIKESLSPTVFQNETNLIGTVNLNMINKGEAILDEIAKYQNKISENNDKLKTAKRKKEVYKQEIEICRQKVMDLSNMYNSTIPRIFVTWSKEEDDLILSEFKGHSEKEYLTIATNLVAKKIIKKTATQIINRYKQLIYFFSIGQKCPETLDWFLIEPDDLMAQYDLLDNMKLSLSNAIVNTKYEDNIHKMYEDLHSDISLVTDEKIINQIKSKMKREQLANHHFSTKLINVFEINQKKAPVFDDSCGNVVTLFHGTSAANLFGILSTYIKLPRNLGSNVHITGHMFGPGCYFGQYSKSLQYSTSRFGGSTNKGNSYYMLLCDVALGKMKFEPNARNYAQAPAGYNSVMGVGDDAFRDGCFITGVGDTKDLKISKEAFYKTLGSSRSQLLHNEFIVYNQNRFKIRYIIEVVAGR